MKRARRSNGMLRSLRVKMLLWAFVFVLPILVILLSSINSAIISFDAQTRGSIDELLTPFTSDIDATLSTAKRYIASTNWDNSAFQTSGRTELDALDAVQTLARLISEDLAIYPEIDAIFLYDFENIHFIQNYNRSYSLSKKAAAALKEELDGRSAGTILFQQGYSSFDINNRCYLYIAMDVPNGVVGCWFDAETLIAPIENARPAGFVQAMFSDRSNRMLNPEFNTPSTKQLAQRLESYFVSTRHLTSAPFGFTVLWDRDIVFAPIAQMRQSVYMSIGVAVFLFALYMVFLRTSLIRPLNQLIHSIDGIQQGNLDQIPIKENENMEIANVYQSLNAMTSQIESLRIQMYEEKLLKQKTQMQLYQLQLRPHFFLNALNTIISFARVNKYDMVQKMTMNLATHCSYVLYSPWFVTIEEELVYTQNFVDMQNTQHNTRYAYLVNADEALYEDRVPILAVQIFVENAIKHFRNPDRPLEIRVFITGSGQADEQHVRICIDDTGDGFDAEAIAILNGTDIYEPSEDDHGIGIANIRQRLRILYGDRASITFLNNESGGAHVEMLLPADRKEGERKK